MIRSEAIKIAAALLVAATLIGQRSGGWSATGATRAAVGLATSALLLASIVALAAPGPARRRRPRPAAAISPRAVFLLLAVPLALAAMAKPIAPFLVLMPRTPPGWAIAALIGYWIVAGVALARRGYSTRWLAAALVGLTVGTRLLAVWAWPFHRLDGDMLETIDRALEALAAGRSPYSVSNPPMPYMPLTWLAYAPARALGVDLRLANVVCDALTALATVHLGRLVAIRSGRDADSGPVPEQLLLPFLMLHPIWTHFGANTQYPPTVLSATLLGFAVLLAGPRIQAAALGLATASNQMLGACGPILLAHWSRRWGPARALGLGALAAGALLLVLAPFLARDARQLLRAAFLERDHFSDALMAGRFSFLPLVSRVAPHAATIATALVLAAASRAAHGSRRPAVALAAMAAGLCAAMLFQPVSFAHYFLPAIALAAIAPAGAVARRPTAAARVDPPAATTGPTRPPKRLISHSRKLTRNRR